MVCIQEQPLGDGKATNHGHLHQKLLFDTTWFDQNNKGLWEVSVCIPPTNDNRALNLAYFSWKKSSKAIGLGHSAQNKSHPT